MKRLTNAGIRYSSPTVKEGFTMATQNVIIQGFPQITNNQLSSTVPNSA